MNDLFVTGLWFFFSLQEVRRLDSSFFCSYFLFSYSSLMSPKQILFVSI